MATNEHGQAEAPYESFLEKQFDAEGVPHRLSMLLKGYWFDPNEMKYKNTYTVYGENERGEIVEYEVVNRPMLNEQGVFDVVTEVRSRIANLYSSATLTHQQIRMVRRGIADVLWQKLRINREAYEMRVEDLKSILFIVDDQIMLFLSRTEKGSFLKALGRLLGRREVVSYSGTEENKPGTGFRKGLFE